ncbi:hypothetical protein KJ644_00845 [Candidatus Dependentiae bacterium]|nr:hypothetical protein [Candidatus Dependentiae bacterium]MBU4387000.1 hypothetical protein [Candidatus Dependentiae bacterium]MCG2756672.1 hypothetical protein [Candidatus Dependentiae bacterium]
MLKKLIVLFLFITSFGQNSIYAINPLDDKFKHGVGIIDPKLWDTDEPIEEVTQDTIIRHFQNVCDDFGFEQAFKAAQKGIKSNNYAIKCLSMAIFAIFIYSNPESKLLSDENINSLIKIIINELSQQDKYSNDKIFKRTSIMLSYLIKIIITHAINKLDEKQICTYATTLINAFEEYSKNNTEIQSMFLKLKQVMRL